MRKDEFNCFVSIAVDKFGAGLADLDGCVRDAEQLREVFGRRGWLAPWFTRGQVGKDNVLDWLKRLDTPDDSDFREINIVIFIATHGCSDGADNYLATHGCAETAYGDMIRTGELRKSLNTAIRNIKEKNHHARCRVLYIVDACRSPIPKGSVASQRGAKEKPDGNGEQSRTTQVREREWQAYRNIREELGRTDTDLPYDTLFWFSCADNCDAWEIPVGKHKRGLFAYSLEQELRSQEHARFWELMIATNEKVRHHSGQEQTPHVSGAIEVVLDIPLREVASTGEGRTSEVLSPPGTEPPERGASSRRHVLWAVVASAALVLSVWAGVEILQRAGGRAAVTPPNLAPLSPVNQEDPEASPPESHSPSTPHSPSDFSQRSADYGSVAGADHGALQPSGLSAPPGLLSQEIKWLTRPGESADHSAALKFVQIPSLDLWVSVHEVTNRVYHCYDPQHSSRNVLETYPICDDLQPVACINYEDAVEFCKWATKSLRAEWIPEGTIIRLPTEKEWEAFARPAEGALYPWGSQWPPPKGVNLAGIEARPLICGKSGGLAGVIETWQDDFPVSAPVTETWPNKYGLAGVGGNVQECCQANDGGGFGAWRGGSWDTDNKGKARVDAADREAETRLATRGFRLVVGPPVGRRNGR